MKRMTFLALLLLSCLGVSILGCEDDDQAVACTTARLQPSGFAGCNMTIIIDEGTERTVLLPSNLDDFVENPTFGQEVCITYVESRGVVSVCMTGKIVELQSVELIE